MDTKDKLIEKLREIVKFYERELNEQGTTIDNMFNAKRLKSEIASLEQIEAEKGKEIPAGAEEIPLDKWNDIFGIRDNKNYFVQKCSHSIAVWNRGYTKYYQVGYDFKENKFIAGENWTPSIDKLYERIKAALQSNNFKK